MTFNWESIRIPYVFIGLTILGVGVWLIRSRRYSRLGVFWGPMIYFRLLGIIFIIFGAFALLVGIGLRAIGPIVITIN